MVISQGVVILQQAILCGKHLTVQHCWLMSPASRIILAVMDSPDLYRKPLLAQQQTLLPSLNWTNVFYCCKGCRQF